MPRTAKKRATRKRTPEQIAAVACVDHGHPPIVNVCMGQVTCARCGDIIGDTLMGGYSVANDIMIGHPEQETCEVCPKLAAKLTRADMKHLPSAVLAEVKALRARAAGGK